MSPSAADRGAKGCGSMLVVGLDPNSPRDEGEALNALISRTEDGCVLVRPCRLVYVRWPPERPVIMRVLRHADVAVTMEIYANASSTATSEALRRLGSVR